jgi:glycosyltransferase involved in cell wall biosynthesis
MSTPSILYPIELSFLRAGSQVSILELLAHRDPSFYRRLVVCPPGPDYVAEVERLGIAVHIAGAHPNNWRFTPSDPVGTVLDVRAAMKAIDALVESENVRLIHAGSLVTALASLPAKRRHPSVRLVMHERGLVYRAHTRYLLRRVARSVDRFVATTETGKRRLGKWGVPSDKITVIPNGTDFHRRAPARDARKLSGPVVGLVANFARVKRHELFVDVIERLPEPVRGVIVGGVMPILGGAPYEAEVRAAAARLSDRIVFTGPRDDIAEWMASMDVLVCTSAHESFGRVLIEAMAVGTPVVATPVGAIPDVIDHGRTGLLAGDADGLAAAVRRLLEDRAFAERMAAAALDEVKQRFDTAVVTRQNEDLYRELLS